MTRLVPRSYSFLLAGIPIIRQSHRCAARLRMINLQLKSIRRQPASASIRDIWRHCIPWALSSRRGGACLIRGYRCRKVLTHTVPVLMAQVIGLASPNLFDSANSYPGYRRRVGLLLCLAENPAAYPKPGVLAGRASAHVRDAAFRRPGRRRVSLWRTYQTRRELRDAQHPRYYRTTSSRNRLVPIIR